MTEKPPSSPDTGFSMQPIDNGGKQPNPQDPSRVVVGFPVEAVGKLRRPGSFNSAGGVTIDGSALDAVLAWIARYVPQSLVGSEETVVVDGIRELTFNGDEALLDMLDLVRVNGRAFVPETPKIVEDLETRGYALGVEAAAGIVDQCNREGPYNAIGAAERIRALVPQPPEVGRCRICGCTEARACKLGESAIDGPPCGWTDETRTLCDAPNCLARAGVGPAYARDAGGRPVHIGEDEATAGGLFPGDPGYVRPL